MIIVKIRGGLGNQLFQYSFGRNLSIKLNTELKLDLQPDFDNLKSNNRILGLGNFNMELNYATVKEIAEFKRYNNEVFARFERKLLKILPFLNKRYMVQNIYKLYKPETSFVNNCYYDGYWQSEMYFKPSENIIRQELRFNFTQNLDNTNNSIFDQIRNSESVSIHIRRGDYLSKKSNQLIYNTCNIQYYKEAIKFIKDRTYSPVFFLFSDDTRWVQNNFEGENMNIIVNNSKSPEIDMYLMSNCKHNIIANSSFSWWGAWLNKNPGKIIVAPEIWYRGILNEITSQLIPPEWNRL